MAGLPRAVGFSLALHGLLGAALLLPRALPPLAPRAPIQFTLLPPRPRALPQGPVGPADKPAEPRPQPQKTAPRPARPKTPRPQSPTRDAAPAAAPEPAVAPGLDGLPALAGDTPLVGALLRSDLVRASPHRLGAERLLAAFPDTRLLAAASALRDPAALSRWVLDRTSGLLVLTADPTALTATNLLVLLPADASAATLVGSGEAGAPPEAPPVATPPGSPDGGGAEPERPRLSGTGLGWDPRRLRALGEAIAVYARPEALAAWESQARREGPRFAARLASPLTGAAALTLWVHRADELLRFDEGLPTPKRLLLRLSAEESPRLELRLTCADPESAAKLAEVLPRRLQALSESLWWLGLRRLLAELHVASDGPEVKVAGALPAQEFDALLDYVTLLLPPGPGQAATPGPPGAPPVPRPASPPSHPGASPAPKPAPPPSAPATDQPLAPTAPLVSPAPAPDAGVVP